MGIWHIMEDPNNYRSLTTSEFSPGEALDIGALFRSGAPLGKSWKPVQVELWVNGDEAGKPIGHFPSLSGLAPLSISARALEVLYPLIKDQVEELDLIIVPHLSMFYALNIFFSDCLDHSKSVFVYFTDGGIMRVEKHAFRHSCLDGKHIFRIPEEWNVVLADDIFKQAVEKNKLEGLIFYKVPLVDDAE